MINRDVWFDERASYYFSDSSSSSNLQILDFDEGESQPFQQNDDRNDGGNETAQDSPLTAERRTRSLGDIYDEIEEIDATNQVFFAFFAGEDPITFEEASKEEK